MIKSRNSGVDSVMYKDIEKYGRVRLDATCFCQPPLDHWLYLNRADFFGPKGDTRWVQNELVRNYPIFQHIEMDIRNRDSTIDLMEYSKQNRIEDHICYTFDSSNMKHHYPGWDISKSLQTVFEEIAESWEKRMAV